MTRIFTSDYDQRYAIAKDERGYTVLRKLPNEEYWDYYMGGREEVRMDTILAYWLTLYAGEGIEDAEIYLRNIGVNCETQEVHPCAEGEARFSEGSPRRRRRLQRNMQAPFRITGERGENYE